jgi:eukaryotic-like serine/threonine-protein kinase
VDSAVREHVGHYRIVSLIGTGGMGDVYLADDPRLGRQVAVKILSESVSRDVDAKRRMVREARAVAALDHPNVCTIHEVGEHEGRPYIVMQYIEGETLFARMERTRLGLLETRDIAMQIASALDHAHARGVVHRDIKPLNVILSPEGLVKVLDFGLAKFAEASDEVTDVLVSKTGVIAGTAPYMSPEQLRGTAIDGRSDLFSLGIMLYEIAAGHRPFDRNSAVATITAILFEEPAPIDNDEFAPMAPIIRRLLAKEPAKRFPTAAILREALQQVHEKKVRSGTRAAAPPAPSGRVKTRIESLAVLPLAGDGATSELEYVMYGLSEGIVRTLAQTRKLRVIASTTVARFAGGNVDPHQAGRELGVDAVVGVRARVDGEQLYVDAELIPTAGGAALWSSQYMRPIRDVASLADTIAGDVAERVRERTGSSAARRPSRKKRAVDPEAEHLFLKGRFQWIKRHPDAIRAAMSYFQQAVEQDPFFALPYAGLADAFVMLGFMQALPPRDILPKAKAAARRAIELDPQLADPHATLGYAAGLFEWDWDTAVRELEEAMRLNPSYPWAPHWLGLLYCGRADTPRALELIERACVLDPLSPIINVAAGIPLHCARRYDEAIARYRPVLETETAFAPAHYYIGLSLEQRHDYKEAIRHMERLLEIAGPASIYMGALGHCYAAAGRRADAERLLEQLTAHSQERYITPFASCVTYTGLGRFDEALAALEASLEERNAWMWFLSVDPRFDPLRQDPRFVALVGRYGLPA